jgi:o-succinylbenzoate---CoA ligase
VASLSSVERNALKFFQDYGKKIVTASLQEKISLLFYAYKKNKTFFLLPAENTQETAEWIFASFHAPVTVVPFSPTLPKNGIQKILEQLPQNSTFFREDFSASILTANPPSSTTKKLDDIWVVIFTSGSTGDPKGVALTGNQLKASAEAHHQRFSKQPWLFSIPPFYVGGFSILSRSFFLDSPFGISFSDPTEIDRWLSGGNISGISMVPTFLEKFLRSFPQKLYPELKTLLLGGANANPSLLGQGKHLPIYLTYGMSETSSQCATAKNPHGELFLLDSFSMQISTDQEILLKGAALAQGYFIKGELVSLPKLDGFFPTGDLGSTREGEIKILGRKSERMISGGVKIFPQEIESCLQNFPGFQDYAICSIPDSYWGEVICLAFVGDPGLKENVKSYLANVLDKKIIPKHIFSLPSLPRTSSGKIQRTELSRIVSAQICKSK